MGKKWGRYKAGGRSQPVSCVYCGRLVPRVKAVPVERGFHVPLRMPGPEGEVSIDRRRVFLSSYRAYACISCARHRGLIGR